MKRIFTLLLVLLMLVSLIACDSGSSKDDYDYDKGYGYTSPHEGESFSDYVKRQDPDLYDSLFK